MPCLFQRDSESTSCIFHVSVQKQETSFAITDTPSLCFQQKMRIGRESFLRLLSIKIPEWNVTEEPFKSKIVNAIIESESSTWSIHAYRGLKELCSEYGW